MEKNKEIMEFVRHLPYDLRMYETMDASIMLRIWQRDIPEKIPKGMDYKLLYKAHILHIAGFDEIDPEHAWIEAKEYEDDYSDDVFFNHDENQYCLRVRPDGVFESHERIDSSFPNWTEFVRVPGWKTEVPEICKRMKELRKIIEEINCNIKELESELNRI